MATRKACPNIYWNSIALFYSIHENLPYLCPYPRSLRLFQGAAGFFKSKLDHWWKAHTDWKSRRQPITQIPSKPCFFDRCPHCILWKQTAPVRFAQDPRNYTQDEQLRQHQICATDRSYIWCQTRSFDKFELGYHSRQRKLLLFTKYW